MKPLLNKLPTRFLQEVAVGFGVLALVAIGMSFLSPNAITKNYALQASAPNPSDVVTAARVSSIMDSSFAIELTDGQYRGTSSIVSESDPTTLSRLQVGDEVLVTESGTSGEMQLSGFYRIPLLVLLLTAFIIIILLIGRRKGLLSIAGLGVSIIVVGWVIVPLITSGFNALFAAAIGACIIAVVSLSIAHGINMRTLLAISSVLVILIGVTLVSVFVIDGLNFTGVIDDASYYLQNEYSDLNLVGILTGGIIIAALGALDDIVMTQVAVVDELRKTDSTLTAKQLFTRASSVGSEHIISLVNTLALVYAGAALPLLVSYATQSSSPLIFFNNEFIATEIARTIIVSIGLVLSVPLSTWVVAQYYGRKRSARV